MIRTFQKKLLLKTEIKFEGSKRKYFFIYHLETVADLGGRWGRSPPVQKTIFGFYQQKRLKNKLILHFIIMIAPSPLQ
jgi:hypothetical protein